jgi:uncharacterized short protein YbdD (DUF466 family)
MSGIGQFFSSLFKTIGPSIAEGAIKSLGDMGAQALTKITGNAGMSAKAVGGVQDYLTQSLRRYTNPTPHEGYRGGMRGSEDFPVQVRRTTGRRRPPGLKDYNADTAFMRDEAPGERPMKRQKTNDYQSRNRSDADFFNEDF